MSAANDGGPAFPVTETAEYHAKSEGMTLRQYYKAAAMQGALSNPNLSDIKATNWITRYAAELADAMIAEDEEHAKK